MKILLLNLEFDCAGVSWNLRTALRAAGHEAVHVAYRPTAAAPHSDKFFKRVEEILPLCEWADVLHFNQWIWTHHPGKDPYLFMPVNDYGSGSPFDSVLKKKKVVYHLHCGPHQLNPQYWLDKCAEAGAAVFKCDPISPINAKWMPNVLDMPVSRKFNPMTSPMSVCIYGSFSDTRRTNCQIRDALEYLGVPFKFFVDDPREQALVGRSRFPLTIDNLTQGFVGMWAWEAMAMGQPVIARIDEVAADKYAEMFGGPVPFLHAPNIDWVGWWISRLEDRSRLAAVSDNVMSWIARCYRPETIVGMYLAEYAK